MNTKYQTAALKNGLKVAAIQMDGLETVSIFLAFGIGSGYETKKEQGITHFIEHMLFKGTGRRPALTQLCHEIDRLGGEIEAFTTKEITCFSVQIVKNHWQLGLDILADMTNNSLFPAPEIKKERNVIIEEINKIADSPREKIAEIFENLLYGDQGLGQTVLGPKKNILAFSRPNHLAYFHKNFLAGNAVLVAAGDFRDNDPLKKISGYFENFRSGKIPPTKLLIKNRLGQRLLIKSQKTDQAYCALGVRAFPLSDARHYAAKLMAIILGGHMSSRLFKKIREEKGLVYNIGTFSENFTGTGYLVTYTSAILNKMPEIVENILEEYKLLAKYKLGQKELEDAKNYLIGKKKMVLESSSGSAFDLARRIILKKIAATPEDYFKKLKNVTADQIKAVAQRLFQNNRFNLVVIGSFSGKQKEKYRKILSKKLI